MRFLAGIVVGAAVGFLAAYVFLGDQRTPVRSVEGAASPGPVAPAAEPEAKAPAPPQTPAKGPRGPLVVRHSGDGVTTVGDLVIIPDGELLGGGSRPLTEVQRALAEARAAADWGAYLQALHELGAMHTAESQALLVEVMGDESLRFAGAWTGQSFLGWLSGCDAPGLLEAARRRAEIDLLDNKDSRWRGAGWLSLVAIHGDEAEIAWIESLGGGERNAEMEVDRALAEGASNPVAAARLAARMKDPKHFLWSPYLESFAQANPRAALEAAVEALPATPDRRTGELLRLIGEATTPETLDRARTAILAQEAPEARLEALRAVERMRRRGLDVSGFARLADEPRLLLERSAARPLTTEEKGLVRGALQAIGYNRVTWSDATRAAVKPFLDHADGAIAAAAREAVADMEDGAKGDGWRPDRRRG
jgi:hypothetical protein